MMILITTLINIVKDWLKENRNYRQVIFSIIEDIIIKLIIYFILYNLYLFVCLFILFIYFFIRFSDFFPIWNFYLKYIIKT